MRSLIVTGFVPDAFPSQHLSQDEFRDLGERLKAAIGDRLRVFGTPFEYCWANQEILHDHKGDPLPVLPSCADVPADRFATPQDMARSNAVLLQRFEWLFDAAYQTPVPTEVLAWVEWSALKQRGVTEEVLQQFADDLERLPPFRGVCAPGCWPLCPIDDSIAHWRFVGSCFVVHRDFARKLFDAVRGVATLRASLTGKISWDMNTLAFVELLNVIPFRWYKADHDETQFTRYREAVA